MRYEQPLDGYRTGIEPVFLAAAIPVRLGERVLEAGTGAGAALICLAARHPGVVAVGVERDPGMAAIATRNAAAWPALSIHVGAIESFEDAARFDHALANPPWHDAAGTGSPDARRRAALRAEPGTLATWCAALARHLTPGGSLTLILPAAQQGAAGVALARAGVGGIRIRALLPRVDKPAKIILVHGRAGLDHPATVLPPLVLHERDGGYTREADRVLRDGDPLGWN